MISPFQIRMLGYRIEYELYSVLETRIRDPQPDQEHHMQPIDSYRKIPKQERAQATVDAILEATARILEGERQASLTTNSIAELAGVSIGTLYQYFPDKNAILVALAREELTKTSQAVMESLSEPADGSALDEPIRASIRALLKGFKGRRFARGRLIEALLANGLSSELAHPVDLAMQEILTVQARDRAKDAVHISEIRAYVLTRAIVGAIRAAVMENSNHFSTKAFEDELVRMAEKMIAQS
nr:TetR/AcrR family transcriptional regulator [uncultured Cohaesibacter sp.]